MEKLTHFAATREPIFLRSQVSVTCACVEQAYTYGKMSVFRFACSSGNRAIALRDLAGALGKSGTATISNATKHLRGVFEALAVRRYKSLRFRQEKQKINAEVAESGDPVRASVVFADRADSMVSISIQGKAQEVMDQ